jgi:hypothetical protein
MTAFGRPDTPVKTSVEGRGRKSELIATPSLLAPPRTPRKGPDVRLATRNCSSVRAYYSRAIQFHPLAL